MSDAPAKSTSKAKLGDVIVVKEGAYVTRPDGSRSTSGGGGYVLDVPGTYDVDGTEVTV